MNTNPLEKRSKKAVKKKPTAKQMKARIRFKKMVQKAKMLRKSNPKMTVAQSMKRASVMMK